MQRNGTQRGFTLIELLITVVFLSLVITALFVGPTGNYWYTFSGVERELKGAHPDISAVVKTTRSLIGKSTIVVENYDGTQHTYLLDSNILFNYEFREQ